MTRTRIHSTLLLILLVIAFSACKREAALGTEAIRGWAESHGYGWVEGPDEILTEQAFFDYINGAAQPIIDRGWKRSVYGVLTRDTIRLRLTLHEMADPEAAASLLEQSAFGDTQPVDVGDRAVYWDRGAFSKGILSRIGNFVCELTLVKDGNREEVLSLARSLEALAE